MNKKFRYIDFGFFFLLYVVFSHAFFLMQISMYVSTKIFVQNHKLFLYFCDLGNQVEYTYRNEAWKISKRLLVLLVIKVRSV